METLPTIFIVFNLILYYGFFYKLYEWTSPIIKSMIANPFLVKEITVYFYQRFISIVKKWILNIIRTAKKILQLCMLNVSWIIKISKFAFSPIQTLIIIVILPPLRPLIFVTESIIGMPIIASTDDQVSLIPRFFTRRFTDLTTAGSTSYFDGVYSWVYSLFENNDIQANIEETPTAPIEPNHVERLYLDPYFTHDNPLAQNMMMEILIWIETENLPRLVSLEDRDFEKIRHWFDYQYPEFLSKSVLIELFSTHRETRLKRMIEFMTTDANAGDLVTAIATLIAISFNIQSPIPVNFTVGSDVPNISRRPFERFIENMANTLQSSQSTFLCDFILSNLTDGNITVDIINKQWTDKNSTSNQKYHGAPFIDEFLQHPFIKFDPKPSKFRIFNRILFWFKRLFITNAKLLQDTELNFLRLYANKTLKDLHTLQELFWFQPSQHPRLIPMPSSSLRASTLNTEDYELEYLIGLNEMLEDEISTPAEIPDVPLERQLTHAEQMNMLRNGPNDEFLRLDISFYEQSIIYPGQALQNPTFDSDGSVIMGQVIGDAIRQRGNRALSDSFHQYQSYAPRLIDPPTSELRLDHEGNEMIEEEDHIISSHTSDDEVNEERNDTIIYASNSPYTPGSIIPAIPPNVFQVPRGGTQGGSQTGSQDDNKDTNIIEETNTFSQPFRLRSFSWPMVKSGFQILPMIPRQPLEPIEPDMNEDAILMSILRDDDDEYVNNSNNPVTSALITSMYHRNPFISDYAQSIIYGSFENDVYRSYSDSGFEKFDKNGFAVTKRDLIEEYNERIAIQDRESVTRNVIEEDSKEMIGQELESDIEESPEEDNNNSLNTSVQNILDDLSGTDNNDEDQTQDTTLIPSTQILTPAVQNTLDDLSGTDENDEEQTQDSTLIPSTQIPNPGVQNILDDLLGEDTEDLSHHTQDLDQNQPTISVTQSISDHTDIEQTQEIALTPPTQPVDTNVEDAVQDALDSLLDLDNAEPVPEVNKTRLPTTSDTVQKQVSLHDTSVSDEDRPGPSQLESVASEELNEITYNINPDGSDEAPAQLSEEKTGSNSSQILDKSEASQDDEDNDSNPPPTFEELIAIETQDNAFKDIDQDTPQVSHDDLGPAVSVPESNSRGSNENLIESGSSFTEIFLTLEERTEFEQHFFSLSTAVYSDIQDLRQKMSNITKIMNRLMSGDNPNFLNKLHALSIKGETLTETTKILQKLRTQFKSTAKHYRHYEEYIQEFELGFTFYRAVEFTNDFIQVIEKMLDSLRGEEPLPRDIMYRIRDGIAESTRMVKNLKIVVQHYLSFSVHLKNPQRQREFRETLEPMIENIATLGYRYTENVDAIRRRDFRQNYSV